MTNRSESAETLDGWLRVPDGIEKAIEGLTEDALDLSGGSNGWSIRENVHHLVEANLVASNIVVAVVAALAQSGCTYDWSWMTYFDKKSSMRSSTSVTWQRRGESTSSDLRERP